MTYSVRRLLTTSKIRLQRTIAGVRYSWQRDRLEAPYRHRDRHLHDLLNSAFCSAMATPQGGYFNFRDVKLTIEFITIDTVRIHWWTDDETSFYQAVEVDAEPGLAKFTTTSSGWELATAQLRIEIAPDGYLDFYDGENRLITRNIHPNNRLPKASHSSNAVGYTARNLRQQIGSMVWGNGQNHSISAAAILAIGCGIPIATANINLVKIRYISVFQSISAYMRWAVI